MSAQPRLNGRQCIYSLFTGGFVYDRLRDHDHASVEDDADSPTRQLPDSSPFTAPDTTALIPWVTRSARPKSSKDTQSLDVPTRSRMIHSTNSTTLSHASFRPPVIQAHPSIIQRYLATSHPDLHASCLFPWAKDTDRLRDQALL